MRALFGSQSATSNVGTKGTGTAENCGKGLEFHPNGRRRPLEGRVELERLEGEGKAPPAKFAC